MDSAVHDELAHRMSRHVGRYADKVPDWDAFPASRGFPELDRAQIRYIGAGGSPKVDDPGTLPADHFTLSIVQQPVGRYGASHAHEVTEAFLVLQGVLTIGWEWDGDVVLARCGPKDMCLHAQDRPHGFRNDGFDPVMVSIMVGKGRPMPPHYLFHPKTHASQLSRDFGAQPGRSQPLDWTSADPRHREMARHIVRYSQLEHRPVGAGFTRATYIGEGGAPAGTFRKDLITLPEGAGVRSYAREVEEAYFVLEGRLTACWEEGGRRCEQRLGPRDLLLTPPGQPHAFRNEGPGTAQFMMVVGTPGVEDVEFRAA